MMLYQPDSADFHKNRIVEFANSHNFESLLRYSHILHLEKLDEIALMHKELENADYYPVLLIAFSLVLV